MVVVNIIINDDLFVGFLVFYRAYRFTVSADDSSEIKEEFNDSERRHTSSQKLVWAFVPDHISNLLFINVYMLEEP